MASEIPLDWSQHVVNNTTILLRLTHLLKGTELSVATDVLEIKHVDKPLQQETLKQRQNAETKGEWRMRFVFSFYFKKNQKQSFLLHFNNCAKNNFTVDLSVFLCTFIITMLHTKKSWKLFILITYAALQAHFGITV